MFVIAFANKEEVGAYFPPQFSAYALGVAHCFSRSSSSPPTRSIPSIPGGSSRTRHRNAIPYGPLPDQPHWFSEALATFYETVEIDGTRVSLGKPGRARQLHDERPVPLAQLFGCMEHACMTGAFYATVWALFTFLATEHAQELSDFMNLLSITPEAAQAGLWVKAFPSLASLDTADHAFHSWIAHGKVLVREYTVKQASVDATDRALGDADALAARKRTRHLQP